MRLFVLLLVFLTVFSSRAWAGGAYEAARSRQVKESVSYIGQAEYYVRQALRALKASEDVGRAPFFDYKRARDDLQGTADEFSRYLRGNGSAAAEAGVAVEVDGRYFADSVKEFLKKKQKERLEPAGERETSSLSEPGAPQPTVHEEIRAKTGAKAGPSTAPGLPSPPDPRKIDELIKKFHPG